MRGVLKYFFEREYSAAQIIGGLAVTWAYMDGRYVLACAAFVFALVICVIGELALERRK